MANAPKLPSSWEQRQSCMEASDQANRATETAHVANTAEAHQMASKMHTDAANMHRKITKDLSKIMAHEGQANMHSKQAFELKKG